ncbi:endonuclease domain-containing protein [Streptomyces sp. NPDC050504]|uniref:endonuclease domain-containing protein n=1 Tax=Streptomyces sp. NPDC050504 TaxID=3365618 RepID=UPI0037AE73BA
MKPHVRRERNRISCFRRKYGLPPAELAGTVAGRHRICCICPTAPAEHVDHCHETGRVRDVLCFSCDAALGQFKDRPDAMRRAAAYVEGNVWKPTLVAPGVYRLPS